ncbi:AEC family transporter [Tropicimonas sediminicola]|uniref:DOD-type homing endonuclease domain-containing protein n=1 Tax=Tropicimonas sediminicola TaxID=1031541 RepID=A0A239JJP8_9RHOB|nr:AEC family transporter [Tropicimonas sediminicola]SNT06101.1 hypothetical protein SAMN05421757_105321 [Tropicimonas sediminicola]
MNALVTVLEITAPVFLLAALGYGWTRMGWDYPVSFITRLAMTLAVPCLIFTALMTSPADPASLAAISLAATLGYVLVAIVLAAFMRFAGLDRRSLLAPMIFGNTGNLGLPLAFFAFGQEGLGLGVAVLAVTTIGMFTLGLLLFSGGTNPARVLREPMLIASLLGGLFLWQGWQTPQWLTNSLELIGQMAIPLMLLTLGVAMGSLHPGALVRSFGLSLVKLVVSAGAGIAAGLALALPPVPMAVLIIQIITPVPVTAYLLAEKYDADAEAVAGLVVVSTFLSVAIYPVALAILL